MKLAGMSKCPKITANIASKQQQMDVLEVFRPPSQFCDQVDWYLIIPSKVPIPPYFLKKHSGLEKGGT